ncbi:MAG: M23 family metallopeptidase [Candidatus Dormibacteria bacterium]
MQLGIGPVLVGRGARRRTGHLLLTLASATLVMPALFALAVAVVLAASTRPAATTVLAGRPMPGWVVTQPYGCTGFGLEPARGTCTHFHFGIDLAAPAGTPVSTVGEGTVASVTPSGPGGGYGLHVVVRHGGGLQTMYAHLADTVVSEGQVVLTGTIVGHEGSTGMSTGPHLHFEVREAGVAVDPRSVFPGIFGPEGQTQTGAAAG